MEREIRLEEIKVDITSDEERWALRWVACYLFVDILEVDCAFLRLVNMLASIKCLMLDGLAVSTENVFVAVSYYP